MVAQKATTGVISATAVSDTPSCVDYNPHHPVGPQPSSCPKKQIKLQPGEPEDMTSRMRHCQSLAASANYITDFHSHS